MKPSHGFTFSKQTRHSDGKITRYFFNTAGKKLIVCWDQRKKLPFKLFAKFRFPKNTTNYCSKREGQKTPHEKDFLLRNR